MLGPSEKIEVQTLVSDEELMIRWMPGSTSSLVLAFSGVRHGLGGLPMDEFAGTASDGSTAHVLFISDMLRSWYSRPGLVARIAAAARSFCAQQDIDRISIIGNSMGGYGAILFSQLLPVSAVAAFGPQVSMHPEVIREPRWRKFRPAFGPELLRSLEEPILASKAKIFVVFGGGDLLDRAQAALSPQSHNLFVHVVPRCDHNVVKNLKDQNLSKPLAQAMLQGNDEEVIRILKGFDAQQIQKP